MKKRESKEKIKKVDELKKRRLGKKVKKTESEYAVFVENSLDVILKLEKGKITFANSAAMVFFGYNYSDLLNLKFKDLITLESREILKKRKAQKEAGEIIHPVFEIIVIRKDGLKIPTETITTFIESNGKRIELIYIRDITERKKAQKALEKLNKELEEKVRQRTAELSGSNRLKDLFIDIMRHDFLNPVGVIKMNLEMAMENEKDNKKRGLLEKCFMCCGRLIKMIENASALSKLESGEKLEFKKQDIGVMLKKSIEELIYETDKKKMKLNVDIKGNFSAVVNPLMHGVFTNLISNATKYGPENSEIIVGIKKQDSNYKIFVADNGEGIPDKYKKAVFERFTRLEKGAIQGSGLGLAITKKIIEIHKGKVWVKDNPKGGSIFIAEIPIK